MNRRDFLAFAAVAALTPGTAAAATRIEVYKSSSCGCCGKWVEHLRLNRFDVTVHEVDDPAVYRARAGIPSAFASCHTALVDGYSVEGHVPAQDIRSLLKNRPNALGLAVPGMPKGSPGMEAARRDAYDVLLVQKDGTSRVYHSYPSS